MEPEGLEVSEVCLHKKLQKIELFNQFIEPKILFRISFRYTAKIVLLNHQKEFAILSMRVANSFMTGNLVSLGLRKG